MDITKEELNGLTEEQYHAFPLDSYSTLKDFLMSFKKYYKKYVSKEGFKEKDNQEHADLRFGSLVDVLKFEPDTFENQYLISTAVVPSGQMLEFVNKLYSLTKEHTNEYGVLCRDMKLMIEESYNFVGVKKNSLDKFTERFLVDKEGYDYYKELVSRNNKIVISSDEFNWAMSLVEYINKHPFTRDFFGFTTNDRFEVINQYKTIGEINGLRLKGMIDKLIIDHKKKYIRIYDMKVMGSNIMFPYNYLKLKYYIQNAVYTTLIRQEFPDYTVDPIRFITIDKTKQYAPVRVRTTEKQYEDAMNGFEINGRYYPGLMETIKNLLWHKEMEIWDCTQEVYENEGEMELRLGCEQIEE